MEVARTVVITAVWFFLTFHSLLFFHPLLPLFRRRGIQAGTSSHTSIHPNTQASHTFLYIIYLFCVFSEGNIRMWERSREWRKNVWKGLSRDEGEWVRTVMKQKTCKRKELQERDMDRKSKGGCRTALSSWGARGGGCEPGIILVSHCLLFSNQLLSSASSWKRVNEGSRALECQSIVKGTKSTQKNEDREKRIWEDKCGSGGKWWDVK